MKRKITTPEWVDGKAIYEVNLRQFTKSGTIKEFESHLPRLKELGVGILWFMPIQPIGEKNRKGTLGSYYSICNYSDINPEFGTLTEFMELVKKIHDLGMKVIIDWVANHTAWDHHWTKDHPEYYTKDNDGNFKAPVKDWEDVIHLDYGNPDLWDAMIGQMAFWIKETEIDGFRCDMAHLVPTLFWNRARRDLDKIKPMYMLAESENHDLLEYAFDSIYNWKLLHAMNELSMTKIKAKEFLDGAINEIKYLPAGASLLNFTSNHDENSWQGSAIERIHYFLKPLTVLTFLLPGIPLIYSGQEAGNHRRLKFFDKDEITWKEDKMFSIYEKLIQLRIQNIDLWGNGMLSLIENDAKDTVASFEIKKGNKRVISILNFSGKDQSCFIKCGNYQGKWRNVISEKPENLICKEKVQLSPYGYLILECKD